MSSPLGRVDASRHDESQVDLGKAQRSGKGQSGRGAIGLGSNEKACPLMTGREGDDLVARLEHAREEEVGSGPLHRAPADAALCSNTSASVGNAVARPGGDEPPTYCT